MNEMGFIETGFIESDLFLAIIREDEETIQRILSEIDEFTRENIHRAALKLCARTYSKELNRLNRQ